MLDRIGEINKKKTSKNRVGKFTNGSWWMLQIMRVQLERI
jgi:hypothetical protein